MVPIGEEAYKKLKESSLKFNILPDLQYDSFFVL